MEKNILYLGSKSRSRQNLLELAQIPYQVLSQDSDEDGINKTLPFDKYVLEIAKHKMQHVILPDPKETTNTIFVLTADTLMRTAHKKIILGKPQNKEDAKRMLKVIRQEPIELITGCCLEQKIYDNNQWKTIAYKHWTTPATLEFCVEEEDIDLYLEKVPFALHACGAGVIENFGLNFLKKVNGSFSSILGLPLFELRQVLKKMCFSS